MFLQAKDYNLLRILFLFEVLRGGGGFAKASVIGYWFDASMSTTYRYLKRLTKGKYLIESTTDSRGRKVACWSLTPLGRKKVLYNWPHFKSW
jgi:DNA-binding MarR family transcriptional regulator